METRQKVILVVLVLLSVLQQGVYWKLSRQQPEVEVQTATQTIVKAVEKDEQERRAPHCSLVHINTAGMAELQTLPGIGPVYAERIIIARREKPFLEKRDLLRVPGIGEKRLAQIADLICLYIEENEEE